MANFSQIGVQVVATGIGKVKRELQAYERAVHKASRTGKELAMSEAVIGKRLGMTAVAYANTAHALAGLGAVLGIGAGAFSVHAISMAAQADRLQNATELLAPSFGSTADGMVSAIDRAAEGTISDFDAMRIANKAMLLGVAGSEDQLESISLIAIRLGRAMGLNATTSIEDMTVALGRQSPLILDNLGITIDYTAALKRYAAANDVAESSLTESIRKQIFMTEALRVGKVEADKLADAQLGMAGDFEVTSASLKNFTVEFGRLLAVFIASDAAIGTLQHLEKGARAWKLVLTEVAPELVKNNSLTEIITAHYLAKGQAIERNILALGKDVNAMKGSNAGVRKSIKVNTDWRRVSAKATERIAAEEAALKRTTQKWAEYTTAILEANPPTEILILTQKELKEAMDETTLSNLQLRQSFSDYKEMEVAFTITGAQSLAQAKELYAITIQGEEDIADAREEAAKEAAKSAKEAADATKDAFTGAIDTIKGAVETQLKPTLDEVWKIPEESVTRVDESARRLATVSTSGFASEWLGQLTEQFGEQEFFQPVMDAIASGDEAALKAAADKVLTENITKLWNVELIKEKTRAALRAQNARQAILDVITEELIGEGLVAAGSGGESVIASILGLGENGTFAVTASHLTGQTLPEMAGAFERMAFRAQEGFENVIINIEDEDLALLNLINSTFPDLETQAGTTLDSMILGFDNSTISVDETKKSVGETASKLKNEMVDAIEDVVDAFNNMRDAAREAASAARDASGASGNAGAGSIIRSINPAYHRGTPPQGVIIPGTRAQASQVIVHGHERVFVQPARKSSQGSGGGGGDRSLQIDTVIIQDEMSMIVFEERVRVILNQD